MALLGFIDTELGSQTLIDPEIAAPGKIDPEFASTSGVTVALTGVSSAVAVGTLAVSFTLAATGVSSATAVGTTGVKFDLAVTGNQSTTAVGTAGVAFSVGTSGNQSSGNTGVFLEGVQASGAVGTLGVKFDVAALGNQSTTAVGTVGVKFDKALTGIQSTTAVGTTGVTFGVSTTGVSATGSTGTTGVTFNRSVTGVSSTTAVGSAASAFGIGPTGISCGTLTGLLGNTHTIGLFGNINFTITGIVSTPSGDKTVGITGVHATSEMGVIRPSYDVRIIARFLQVGDANYPSSTWYFPSGYAVAYGNIGPYAQAVIQDGVTNYFRCDDPLFTSVKDFVGGVNASISGNPQGVQVQGALGDGNTARNTFWAGSFSNVLPSPPSLQIHPTVMTWEGWIFPRSFAETMPVCGGAGTMQLGINTSGHAFFLGSSIMLAGTTPIKLGYWHHLVMVKTATNRSIYLDGVLEATDANGDDWITAPNRFQFAQLRFTLHPNHSNDEIALYYGVALTPQQIANHYALASRKMPSVTPHMAFPPGFNDIVTSQTLSQPKMSEDCAYSTNSQVVFFQKKTQTFEG